MEAVADPHDLTGQTIGDYRVIRLLGEGGMGQVYLCEQLSLKRPIALKILKPELAANAAALQRFKAEAEAVAKASHPNIVQVYAIGELNGLPFMALEYVEGFTLRDYLTKKGPPSVALALSFIRQGAAALQRAAELGIIHRDIKPENILLTRRGTVKIADFGLSRVLTTSQPALNLTQTGVTMGTPLYMSPEQVQGKTLDPRSDIYSFGVTCYHMLTGNPPFRGQTAFEIALQHVQTPPQPLEQVRPDLSAELCAVVHKMMAKNPDERYQTARELLQDAARLREKLGGAAGQPETLPDLVTVPRVAAKPRVRQPIPMKWWIGGSLLLALASGAVAGWITRPTATDAPVTQEDETPIAVPPPIPAAQQREQLLWADLRESAGRPGTPRLQAVKPAILLAIGYFDQGKLADADRLFVWLVEPNQAREFQTIGRLGQAMVLALRNQASESITLFQQLCTGKDAPIYRVAPTLNKHPAFLKWVDKALDFNAANLSAVSKPLPPELEALRKARPLPTKPGKSG